MNSKSINFTPFMTNTRPRITSDQLSVFPSSIIRYQLFWISEGEAYKGVTNYTSESTIWELIPSEKRIIIPNIGIYRSKSEWEDIWGLKPSQNLLDPNQLHTEKKDPQNHTTLEIPQTKLIIEQNPFNTSTQPFISPADFNISTPNRGTFNSQIGHRSSSPLIMRSNLETVYCPQEVKLNRAISGEQREIDSQINFVSSSPNRTTVIQSCSISTPNRVTVIPTSSSQSAFQNPSLQSFNSPTDFIISTPNRVTLNSVNSFFSPQSAIQSPFSGHSSQYFEYSDDFRQLIINNLNKNLKLSSLALYPWPILHYTPFIEKYLLSLAKQAPTFISFREKLDDRKPGLWFFPRIYTPDDVITGLFLDFGTGEITRVIYEKRGEMPACSNDKIRWRDFCVNLPNRDPILADIITNIYQQISTVSLQNVESSRSSFQTEVTFEMGDVALMKWQRVSPYNIDGEPSTAPGTRRLDNQARCFRVDHNIVQKYSCVLYNSLHRQSDISITSILFISQQNIAGLQSWMVP